MAARILVLRFDSPAGLLAQESHADHGGLFVPCPEPAPVVPSDVQVRVEAAGGIAEMSARVVQVFPAGMALTFADPEAARLRLTPLFATARHTGGGGLDAGAVVTWVDELPMDEIGAVMVEALPELSQHDVEARDEANAPEVPALPGTQYDRIRGMSVPQKRNLALKGDRAARLILIKDTNKTLHAFLLKNPRITIDEVKLIASNRQANPEALKLVAENQAWLQNPAIVTALVRNPKTPSQIAVRLLDRLPVNELRQIAKSGNAGRAVVQAAKKKVIGNR